MLIQTLLHEEQQRLLKDLLRHKESAILIRFLHNYKALVLNELISFKTMDEAERIRGKALAVETIVQELETLRKTTLIEDVKDAGRARDGEVRESGTGPGRESGKDRRDF